MAKVKVDNRQTDKQTDRQTDKQTGQKQYAPDHSIRGHKNITGVMFLKHTAIYSQTLLTPVSKTWIPPKTGVVNLVQIEIY